MKGVDASYSYEGYNTYGMDTLQPYRCEIVALADNC